MIKKVNRKLSKKIYFIGIKGVGMSALACIYKKNGWIVSGSDVKEKFITDNFLKKSNIRIYEGFSDKNLDDFKPDLIVYSTAYKEDNVEIKKAKERNLAFVSYPEALSFIFNNKYGIAVCGSHGKTTTSAFLSEILEQSGLDPTALVGSLVNDWNSNNRLGKSNLMVAETDEYQNKLKYYFPKAVILLNIDFDHPDFFKNPKDYEQTFSNFIIKIPKDGFIVFWEEDPICSKLVKKLAKCKTISFGIKKGDYTVKIKKLNNFDIFKKKKKIGNFNTKLLGKHNILNCLSSVICSLELKADISLIKKAVKNFSGTKRRLEKKGEKNGILVFDDYAHHPSEIKATIETLKEYFLQKRIFCIFQPHTFSRTEALFDDFTISFKNIYQTIILDIYSSAREKKGKIHSRDLVKKAKEFSNVKYIPNIEKTIEYLNRNLKKGDILITMGASDIWKLGEKWLKR
jgi:UDP-N-acetylmuramate--alanine ligase